MIKPYTPSFITEWLSSAYEYRFHYNQIIGHSRELLKDQDSLTSVQKEALSAIYQSGQFLLTIFNDLLDASNIETGKISRGFRIDEVDLYSVIEQFETGEIALEPKTTLETDVQPGLPKIWTDILRLKMIIKFGIQFLIYQHPFNIHEQVVKVTITSENDEIKINMHRPVPVDVSSMRRGRQPFTQPSQAMSPEMSLCWHSQNLEFFLCLGFVDALGGKTIVQEGDFSDITFLLPIHRSAPS